MIRTLEKKRNLAEVLARFEAWWRGERLDRPPVTVTVPGARGDLAPPPSYATPRDRWFDVERKLDEVEADVDGGIYVADTFPMYMPNLGPEICATVFGAELVFGRATSWSKPCAASVRAVTGIEPNLSNPHWEKLRELTDRSLERGRGRWITGVSDLHTNGDLLAALRDPQELAMDLMDDPEGVRLACEHVTNAFPLMFNDLWKRIEVAGQPCTTWTPALHAGPWYVPNCDFSALISPAMFNEAILPSIRREMAILDAGLYHLDGRGALPHLDALLAWPGLNAVQWVYGAGQGPAAAWTDVYRRIQAAGKGLQVLAENIDDAKAVLRHLSPRGVWICTHAGSQAEAEDFVAWVTAWSDARR